MMYLLFDESYKKALVFNKIKQLHQNIRIQCRMVQMVLFDPNFMRFGI